MVELRKYSPECTEAFARLRNNPNILMNGYDQTPSPYTAQDAGEHFQRHGYRDPAERFLIFRNGELAGEIGITPKEDVFRLNAEIGYFVGEPFWGKGIATEAIGQMVRYTFHHFDFIRIVAGVFEYNRASMKALEKNGFYLESIRKKAVVKNGRVMDDYIWVKLKEDCAGQAVTGESTGLKTKYSAMNSLYL